MCGIKPPHWGLQDIVLFAVATGLGVFVLTCMFCFSAYYATDYYGHVSTYMDSLGPWSKVLDQFQPQNSLRVSLNGDEAIKVIDDLSAHAYNVPADEILLKDDLKSVNVFVNPPDDLLYAVEGLYNGLTIDISNQPFDTISYPMNLTLVYNDTLTANYVVDLLHKEKWEVGSEFTAASDTSDGCSDEAVQCGAWCYSVKFNTASPVVFWGEDGLTESLFSSNQAYPVRNNIDILSSSVIQFNMDCGTELVTNLHVSPVTNSTESALYISHSLSPYLEYIGDWGDTHISILRAAIAFFILFIITFLLFIAAVPVVKAATKNCIELRATVVANIGLAKQVDESLSEDVDISD